MATIEDVSATLDYVTSEGGVGDGFFSTVIINTPNVERYKSTLRALNFDNGDPNFEPDNHGVVSTMFNTSDGLMGVLVSYQGDKPVKATDEESEPVSDFIE
jgi:hypothetical protein